MVAVSNRIGYEVVEYHGHAQKHLNGRGPMPGERIGRASRVRRLGY